MEVAQKLRKQDDRGGKTDVETLGDKLRTSMKEAAPKYQKN